MLHVVQVRFTTLLSCFKNCIFILCDIILFSYSDIANKLMNSRSDLIAGSKIIMNNVKKILDNHAIQELNK